MITYSIIQKAQIEGAHRIDAEYYKPEYLIIDDLLLNRSQKLIKLAEIKGGKRLPVGETFDSVTSIL